MLTVAMCTLQDSLTHEVSTSHQVEHNKQQISCHLIVKLCVCVCGGGGGGGGDLSADK